MKTGKEKNGCNFCVVSEAVYNMAFKLLRNFTPERSN